MRPFSWLRTTSLSQQYLVFSVVLPLLLLVAVACVGWFNYSLALEDRRARMVSQIGLLSDSIIEPLVYMEGFAQVIAERIVESGDVSPENIAGILQHSTIPSKVHKDVFAWTLFDFVTPDGRVIASSIHGVLPNPKRVDPARRSWMTQAPLHPGRLLISRPDIGITSGKWIIPGGYGVATEKGTFLGTVSFGVSIDKLLKSMASKTSEAISFILIDADGGVLVNSAEKDQGGDPVQLSYDTMQSEHAKLPEPVTYKGRRYTYYQKIPKYGFTLLLGENPAVVAQEFRNKVLPQIIQTLVIGTLLLLMMYFFKRRIVSPILQLSQSAEQIMQSKGNLKMPKRNSYEIYILAKQMINLQRYVRRLQRIDQRLFTAKKEAERANQAKSDFLANMSHELRTPLNAIIGYSEMIRAEILGPVQNEKYKEYAYDIHSSGIHLLSLINDLLDISKAESGKFAIMEETVDIVAVAKESVRLVTDMATKKRISLHVDIRGKIPPIRADRLRMKQILINLLSNSVKFSEAKTTVRVSVLHENGLIIQVIDQGVGIAEKDIPKIMEKFGSVRNVMSRHSEGTGLGLWLTNMLVDAHGGKLSLDSTPGKGTTVTIHLPEDVVLTTLVDEKIAA